MWRMWARGISSLLLKAHSLSQPFTSRCSVPSLMSISTMVHLMASLNGSGVMNPQVLDDLGPGRVGHRAPGDRLAGHDLAVRVDLEHAAVQVIEVDVLVGLQQPLVALRPADLGGLFI